MLFTKAIKETLSGFYHWSRQHEDTTGPHMHKGSNAEYLHCLFQIALHKHAVLYYFLLFYDSNCTSLLKLEVYAAKLSIQICVIIQKAFSMSKAWNWKKNVLYIASCFPSLEQ